MDFVTYWKNLALKKELEGATIFSQGQELKRSSIYNPKAPMPNPIR
jgi:hypothetical protein